MVDAKGSTSGWLEIGRSLDLDVGLVATVEVGADRLLILEPVEYHDQEGVVVFDRLLRFLLAHRRARLQCPWIFGTPCGVDAP